ncbi:uncharacterized protein RJT20DRAFT_40230 [Scheffersomyces xylosifermentans]|uniref:uncharacterized protein n=1 Tax=Scheffersomyces xylosifermentans TaxID=1304137 RepID=UPI00315D8A94
MTAKELYFNPNTNSSSTSHNNNNYNNNTNNNINNSGINIRGNSSYSDSDNHNAEVFQSDNNFDIVNNNQSNNQLDANALLDSLVTNNSIIDLISPDMDFEQAYLMYSNLQQKNALNSFEQLQMVQMLNQQYTTTLDGTPAPQSNAAAVEQSQQFNFSQAYHPTATGTMTQAGSGSGSTPLGSATDAFNYHRSQIVNNGLMNNAMNKKYAFNTPRASGKSDDGDDEFDQFFSNTESDALEKFLDNLANPNGSTNPLQFYYNNIQQQHNNENHNNQQQASNLHQQQQHHQHLQQHAPSQQNAFGQGNDYMFDLYTMKPNYKQNNDHEHLKKELTEAFSHPSLKLNSASPNQLPTPSDSRQSSSSFIDEFQQKDRENMITPPTQDGSDRKHGLSEDDEDDESESDYASGQPKKRRRSSHKPLLSLEQKRLNHSHSEQKRRQLCKLAYQRCLRQIIDIEAFNKLPAINEEQRKSKRARVNKDGLPNLSKHNALIRISNEIILIKTLNEKLKKFVEGK